MRTKLVDMHYYREPNKAKLFSDTCKALGLSTSAIVNLAIDLWMESKEEYLEAKKSFILSKNRNTKKGY